MFGIKTKTEKLCDMVSKEIESKGYCAWPVKDNRDYNLGVTLPDNIKQSEEEVKKFRDAVKDIQEKYMDAEIKCCTEPIFSAGGVYATYLSVKPADLVRVL